MKRSAHFALAVLLALAATSAFARAVPIKLHTSAAESFTAYVAGPKTASKGIVLVHDWFGVSPFYTQAAERLATDGYRVVAVDLYGGRAATTHEEAARLLQTVHDDFAGRETHAAIQSLVADGQNVATMGFSMGARHALAASLRNPSVHATLLWYGETIRDAEQLRHLAGPALLVVGSRDGSSAADDSAAFSKAADAAGVGAEVYLYPGAAHAFAQPLFNQGKTFDPAAADVAWRLSESFLERRLR